jgi:DnaJ family protein C protein 2
MATVVICGGLSCKARDVVPLGLAHALASERLRQATTDCSKDLTRSASLASLATSGSLNSLNDDDVGPTKAIDENDLDQTNYYELLGLEKSGIGVDSELVKRAYHKALLLYHPDKGSAKYDTDAVFLAVQKAYDILSDKTKRRAYDSTNEFDDTIPSGDHEDGFDFYATYGPVFRANARFAEKLPVPDLGDADSSERSVEAFYAYWVRFESWRDFDLETQTNEIHEEMDRYEKRHMKKENAKLAAKRKREEMERIILLVERARQNDPRLKLFAKQREDAKREKREAREREKRAKEDAARAEAEAVQREKDRIAAEKMSAAKKEKEENIKRKKAKRRAEKLLRKANDESSDPMADLDFLKTVDNLTSEETCALAARLPDDSEGALADLRKLCTNPIKRKTPAKKVVKIDNAEKKKAPWSEEEKKCLDKACKRFKAGSMQRWEQIADYINTQLGLDVPRTRQECIEQFQKPLVDPKQHAERVINKAPPPPVDGWSAEQQKQLEKALRDFPASMEKNERWSSIANAVAGKSKRDCVARFKELRAALKK